MRTLVIVFILSAILLGAFAKNGGGRDEDDDDDEIHHNGRGIPSRLKTLEDRQSNILTTIAQLIARLQEAEEAALMLVAKNEVTERQHHYNRDFDACIALGSSVPHTDSGFQHQLNKVVNVFCPDGEFSGWRAWYKGAVSGSIPMTRVDLLARYDNYCGPQFVNVSRHIVTNHVVTPFIGDDGRQYAELNASIAQWDFQSNMANPFRDFIKNLSSPGLNPDVAAGWNMNLGWYNNIYLKQANGQWCIKEFNAYTSNLNLFPVVSIGQSFSVFMN